jgi:hypothetical protein
MYTMQEYNWEVQKPFWIWESKGRDYIGPCKTSKTILLVRVQLVDYVKLGWVC